MSTVNSNSYTDYSARAVSILEPVLALIPDGHRGIVLERLEKDLRQCGPNNELERMKRLVDLFKAAWMETRMEHLREHGMKIEQARIHADSELRGHMIRFEIDEDERQSSATSLPLSKEQR